MTQVKITYEDYSAPDEQSILQLLSMAYSDDKQTKDVFKRGWKSTNNLLTLLAKTNKQELVGAITAWKSQFHPFCTYIAMVIHPIFRSQGLEDHLIERIQMLPDVSLPLQTSLWETDLYLRQVYQKLGFKEMRRTYMPILELEAINIELVTSITQDKCNPDLQLFSLDKLQGVDQRTSLNRLIKQIYEETHRDNPLGMHDHSKWEKLIFGSDTLMEGSFVVLSQEKKIIAFALLHEGDTPYQLDLGWRGCTESLEQIIPLITALQITYAKENGYKTIRGEIDTTDPYAMEMLNHFCFSPTPTLITIQKKSGEGNKIKG